MGNCDNKYQRIDHSLGLSLRSSASLTRILGNSSGHKILSWCFQGKTTGVPKPVYATVLMVKVSEFIRFWYPHPTNLTDLCLYNVSRAYFPIMKQEFTENFCPWKYIYSAVIIVKSVKVLQKYFLCLGVVKSNNIGIFVRAWPWFNYFVHPILKEKVLQNLFLPSMRL